MGDTNWLKAERTVTFLFLDEKYYNIIIIINYIDSSDAGL